VIFFDKYNIMPSSSYTMLDKFNFSFVPVDAGIAAAVFF